jgi:hypothetical protein
MEQFGAQSFETPENLPRRYSEEEVLETLTKQELEELNSLVDTLFVPESGDEVIDGDDLRFKRWYELDQKAQGNSV